MTQSSKKEISINIKSLMPVNLLTLLFIYLKITHQIDWSWLWVLAPSWIPVAIFGCVLGFFMGVAVLCEIFK